MIIPEDDGFLPVSTSNLNSFNNIMVIKVADSWKSNGETTYQLCTLDRSRGLSGWPADHYLNKFLPDHEMRVEQANEPKKKEINLNTDTTAVRPKLFYKHEINYRFKRIHHIPSPKKNHRISLNARFGNSNRPMNNSRWEPVEPPKFDPPIQNRNYNFMGKGLLGDCPVDRILPSASLLPFPPAYHDYPPPRENHMQNVSVFESKFDGMEPLKNFVCTKRDSRKERETDHKYKGNYSQPGKIQGSRLNASDEPYNNYTESEREKPCSSFMYDNSYTRNEAPGRSHISSNMDNRNFQGNFSNVYGNDQVDDSYMGKNALGQSHVSSNIENRDFRGNFRIERPFDNQHEGLNNEIVQNNQKSSYPRRVWRNGPNQKPNFRSNNNSTYRKKRNSYLPFHRKAWPSPSPMKNQNLNRRFRKF